MVDRKKAPSVRILRSLSVAGGVSSTIKALDELTDERPTKSVPTGEVMKKNGLHSKPSAVRNTRWNS